MLGRVVCLALVSTCLIHVQTVAAQDGERAEEWTGEWVFMAGWQRLDVDGLNDRLRTSGFPSFPAGVLSLGGGGWAFKDRFLIGGNGHGLLARERMTSDGTFRANLAGGYGQVDLGYRLYTNERLDVYPIAGFGAGAMTLEIVEQGSATFDEILGNPLTMSRLSSWGFLFDLAAAADVRVTGAGEDEGTGEAPGGGFSMGIRVGYTFWPGDWEWDVPGGPEFAVRGLYVRAMVGGWAR
jgi:hypothetical protein